LNTKRIITTKVKKLWEFPPLIDGKQGKVVTKHFTNLSFLIPPSQFSFISFLIYQSGADNVVRYSTALLKMYQQAVIKGSNRYKSTNPYLMTSEPKLRDFFEWYIENGLMLPCGDKEFMINPSLTFSKLYVRGDFYKEWVKDYGDLRDMSKLNELINSYLQHVEHNFQKRKK